MLSTLDWRVSEKVVVNNKWFPNPIFGVSVIAKKTVSESSVADP